MQPKALKAIQKDAEGIVDMRDGGLNLIMIVRSIA